MTIAHGRCLCGAVRYDIAPPPDAVWFCHCAQCRKAQGTAFAASVPVPRAHFTLVSGADVLRAYRATPAKARWFCSLCGSPIYSQVDGADVVRVRAGTLDAAVELVPQGHIFVADRAAWYTIRDDLAQYAAREPSRG